MNFARGAVFDGQRSAEGIPNESEVAKTSRIVISYFESSILETNP